MFAERGISTAQVSILLFIWSFTAFALEVPTGALADRFSRRHVLAAAQLVRAFGYLIWWLMPSFTGYAIGFFLWGVESALTSGAFEALVYDELHARGEADRYARVMGRAASWSLLAQILVGVAAAFVVRGGFGPVLGCSVAAGVAAAMVALSFPRAAPVVEATEHGYLGILREGVREVATNPAVRSIVVFSGALLGFGSVDEFLSLVLREAGIDNAGISLWFAAFMIAALVGSLVAHRGVGLARRGLTAAALVWGATLLIAARWSTPAGALALVAFTGVFAFLGVALDARLQAAITSNARATVTSVQSLLMEITALLTYVTFGLVSTRSTSHVATGVIGAMIVLVALVYGLGARRGRTSVGGEQRRRGTALDRIRVRQRSRIVSGVATLALVCAAAACSSGGDTDESSAAAEDPADSVDGHHRAARRGRDPANGAEARVDAERRPRVAVVPPLDTGRRQSLRSAHAQLLR